MDYMEYLRRNIINCKVCNNKIKNDLYNEYELKECNSIVNICIECENNGLVYFDYIKRNCLIDGESYELTKQDKEYIRREKKRKRIKEEEERALDIPKSIFYFTNKDGRNIDKLDPNFQVIKYANFFLDNELDKMDNIQRFKFPYHIFRKWEIKDFEGLDTVIITLNNYSKEIEKHRKPSENKWKERTRTWYSGKIKTDVDLYNTTFGFATYSDKENNINDVYINYDYICSKSYGFRKLIKKLLKEDGWNVKG